MKRRTTTPAPLTPTDGLTDAECYVAVVTMAYALVLLWFGVLWLVYAAGALWLIVGTIDQHANAARARRVRRSWETRRTEALAEYDRILTTARGEALAIRSQAHEDAATIRAQAEADTIAVRARAARVVVTMANLADNLAKLPRPIADQAGDAIAALTDDVPTIGDEVTG